MTNGDFCFTMLSQMKIPADIISDGWPESFYRDAPVATIGERNTHPRCVAFIFGSNVYNRQAEVRLPACFLEEIIMELMEQRILTEGKILPGGILKVGSFLNQQIDTQLLSQIGQEIARLYRDAGVTKVLTIESSGIAIAAAAGIAMGVPVVFAKKHRSSNVDGKTYTAAVHSYTHNTDYTIVVSSDYLLPSDTVLLVDDFLANGKALQGLTQLVEAAGAKLAGAAVAIEKGFQGGGDALRAKGIRVESLAILDRMEEDGIVFRH